MRDPHIKIVFVGYQIFKINNTAHKVCTSVDVISSAPLDKNGKSDLQFKPLSDQYFLQTNFLKKSL